MTTPTTVNVRLKLRSDTASNWTSANPTLLAGELGRETDTGKIKIGTGSTAWTALAYQPFGAPITNADISATAEIAVSKLADGTARQLLQTDAAGTGVEWASNIDIPGTLDVTGAATFDAAVTVTGDLTVNGTTTTISTQNLLVEDKNIIIGDVATPTDVTADGGGITLKGATDKTINWVDATNAWTSSERFSVPLGTDALPSLTFGDANTGIYSPGASQVAITTAGVERVDWGTTEVVFNDGGINYDFRIEGDTNANLFFVDASADRVGIGTASPGGTLDIKAAASTAPLIVQGSSSEFARIDSSGRLLVGTSTKLGSTEKKLEVANGSFGISSFANNAFASAIVLEKGRGTVPGTIVQNGDELGALLFRADDGVDSFTTAASIYAYVDGAPGADDMPGRLVLSTTPDGTAIPVERFRITNDGVIAYDQPAPAAVNATATLTVANLKAGIITSTSAAATDMTLPTGTDTEGGFAANSLYNNFTFEWSVINTGPSLVRVLAGTAHTIVGSGSVATGTSGRFASRRTAANTFVSYRLN